MYSPPKFRQGTDCGCRGLALRSASVLLQQCLKALNDSLPSILNELHRLRESISSSPASDILFQTPVSAFIPVSVIHSFRFLEGIFVLDFNGAVKL